MHAFVTGSTGLLGNNLVRELLRHGHEVSALVRSREKAEKQLSDTAARLVLGDMTDVAGFADALRGVDVVFHTAAYFREYYGPGEHAQIIEQINVQGTLQLAAAAHARGVKKFVDTSSSGIIGTKPDGSPGDESTPAWGPARENLYFASKLRVEPQLRTFARESGMFIASALPTWMWGPNDAGPTPSGQLVFDALAGKLPPVALPGGSSVVDARDVARGMIAIAERGQNGERYILSHGFRAVHGLMSQLAELTGTSAPRGIAPYPIALTIAAGAQLWSKLTGQTSVLSIEGVRVMNAKLAATAAKAERELGVTFRPFEETMRDTVAWARSQRAKAVAVQTQSATYAASR